MDQPRAPAAPVNARGRPISTGLQTPPDAGPSLASAGRARFIALRRPLRVVIGTAATLAALLLIARALDAQVLREIAATFAREPQLLALFGGSYAAAFALRAKAWRHLLAVPLPAPRLFAILHAALLANHVLPFKAGELVRPRLAWRSGVPAFEAATSSVVARVLDLAALLVIAALLLPWAAGASAQLGLLAAPAALVAAAGAALLALRRGLLPFPLPTRAEATVQQIRVALETIGPRAVATAGTLTLLSWMLESVALLVTAHAAGLELSIAAAVAVTAFTILFQVVHVTPGGLGVYELSMAGALQLYGMPFPEAVAVATATHGLKFAYAFAAGGPLALVALGVDPLAPLRGSASRVRGASRFEIVAARLWNVLNEGKPFTPVFVVGTVALLVALQAPGLRGGLRFVAALLLLTPLFVTFYRYDFPLRLRSALWALLASWLVLTRSLDVGVVALVLVLYLTFTVVLWGTVYYHLRIGTAWTNWRRFWRLVIENPDPTSGNFLEQVPKALLLLLAAHFLVDQQLSPHAIAGVETFSALVFACAVLVHQWWFNWAPPAPQTPTRLRNEGAPISRRVILVVIDGCRADRFAEARTPFLDRLATEGAVCDDMRTVYPARTVTAFSSMLTGAPPRIHGMRSNFVPSLGVKCESIFDVLAQRGLCSYLVGIAHLVDAFGARTVQTVTAVARNDEIDGALAARAREVLERDDPDLLVLQTLSVDQTGHARGSYYPEYLARIEETDRLLEEFLRWCGQEGYLDRATVVVTSDHGQGRGIGGHGHLTEPERRVPFIAWGEGVRPGTRIEGPRSLLDVAPTLAYYLGVPPPEQSVGQVLVTPKGVPSLSAGPLAIIIPAYNEAETLSEVLARIPRARLAEVAVIVVDDGSSDGTAAVARQAGADYVVSHACNRGLGAALRTGLATARELDARAAVYLDADLEYDPAEIPTLLRPIEDGAADYVLGSRFLGHREGHSLLRSLGNRSFTLLLSLIAGHRISDGQTGFRAFSARALEAAEIIHDYNYAQVLTLDLLHKGMRLAEVPVSYRHRTRGRSFITGHYLWRVPLGIAREVLSD